MKDDNDRLLDQTLPQSAFDGTEPFDTVGSDGNDMDVSAWSDPIPIGPTAKPSVSTERRSFVPLIVRHRI